MKQKQIEKMSREELICSLAKIEGKLNKVEMQICYKENQPTLFGGTKR